MSGELLDASIGDAIVYVADKLGYTVEQMFKIYAEAQATIAAIQLIVYGVCTAVVIVVILIGLWHMYKLNKLDIAATDHRDSSNIQARIWITLFVMVLFVSIACIVAGWLPGVLVQIYCPEYAAINQLLAQFGGFVP